MKDTKQVFLRCVDNAEQIVFNQFDWDDDAWCEISIEDSYCGGDYMGIKGRFKRAWHAFWAKPIAFTSVCCDDKDRMKKFLTK